MSAPIKNIIEHQVTDKKITLSVELVSFEEDGLHFCYAPALDLMGYGRTNQEARESWETVLEEYLEYVVENNTLQADLEQRGWNVKKLLHSYAPPPFTYMLQHNPQLQEVYNKHDFNKTTANVQFPTFA